MTQLRIARPEDAARLVEIYAPYVLQTAVSFEYDVPSVAEFRGRVERTLEKYPYLTVWEDDVLCGYAYAGAFLPRRAYDRSAEVSIYLDMACRRRGYGRRLYDEMAARLRAQGIANLYACIAVPRTADDPYLTMDSPDFHAALGFRRVGYFAACAEKFGRLYDMVYMEKCL